MLKVVNSIMCQSRDHFETYFNELCADKERSAVGIVLRDPAAWYFQADSFLTKEVTSVKPFLITSFRHRKKPW
jgi:hypothetical protein